MSDAYPVPVSADGTPMSDEQMAELLGQSVEGWQLIKNHYERERRARRDWEAFSVEERTLIDDTRRGLDEETRARRWKELTARQWELHRIVPRPDHLKAQQQPQPWEDDDDVPDPTLDQEQLRDLKELVVAVVQNTASAGARLLWVQMLLLVLVLLELYRLFR